MGLGMAYAARPSDLVRRVLDCRMSLIRRLSHIRGETADLLTDLVKAREERDSQYHLANKACIRGAGRDLEKALVLLERAKGKLQCDS